MEECRGETSILEEPLIKELFPFANLGLPRKFSIDWIISELEASITDDFERVKDGSYLSNDELKEMLMMQKQRFGLIESLKMINNAN